MGNGIFEIEVSGQSVKLRFNVQAGLLFQSMMAAHQFKATSQESNIALMSDLFYAGMYGESIRSGKQATTREEAMDMFDEFASNPAFMAECLRMWQVWGESVVGSAYVELQSKKKEPESLV